MLREEDTSCDYMRLHILMSYDCETEVLGSDSDSDIPTIRPRKRFRFVPYFLLVKEASAVRGEK
jgi:hypothetical protein